MKTIPAAPATVATNLATTLYWPDIPDVTATMTPLLPGVDQCVLKYRKLARVHLVLLPGALFSITDHATTSRVDGGVAFALGRVISDRGECGRVSPTGFSGFEEKERVGEPLGDAGPMRWADIPDLTVTPRIPSGRDILQWTIRTGREEALLTWSCNSNLPIGAVALHVPNPSPPLLTALGRLALAQYNQLKFGHRL